MFVRYTLNANKCKTKFQRIVFQQTHGVKHKLDSAQSVDKMHINLVGTKTIKSISQIPITLKASTVFGVIGFISGLSLLTIPKEYIETELSLPFPNIHRMRANSEPINYQLIALFLICSSCYGHIGGRVYQYKTFKLGDQKRFYKVLGNLVQKTPLAFTHCAGFSMVVYYGMFGTMTLLESLIFGKPYGMSDDGDANNKRVLKHDSQSSTMQQRSLYALQLTAHWTQSTMFVVLPLFLCGSTYFILYHRKYWLSLFSRLKKP